MQCCQKQKKSLTCSTPEGKVGLRKKPPLLRLLFKVTSTLFFVISSFLKPYFNSNLQQTPYHVESHLLSARCVYGGGQWGWLRDLLKVNKEHSVKLRLYDYMFICGMERGGWWKLLVKGAKDFSGYSLALLGTTVFSDSIQTLTDMSLWSNRAHNSATMGQVVGGKGLEVILFPKEFLMCTEDQKPSQHKQSYFMGLTSPKWFWIYSFPVVRLPCMNLEEWLDDWQSSLIFQWCEPCFFLKCYQFMTFQSQGTTKLCIASRFCLKLTLPFIPLQYALPEEVVQTNLPIWVGC